MALLWACAWSTVAALGASTVTINAGTVQRTLSDQLYGQNMSVYDSSYNVADSAYTAAVAAMGTVNMRIPGGGYGSMVDWNNIEAGPYGSCGAQTWMVSMSEMLAFAGAVGPKFHYQPIINYKGLWCPTAGNIASAVTKAADWVKYLNVTGGGALRADYWEIGNETFFTGDPSYEANGTTYGTNFVSFYNAMKAVDPTIKVGAQCQFDYAAWSQNALTAIKAAGVTPDFLIAHAYPVYRTDVASFDQASTDTEILTTQVDGAASRTSEMNAIVSAAGYSAGTIPYWMTEYRSSVPEGKSIEWVDTLWSAQYLLELGRLGWQGANIWAIKNGYSTAMQSDFGLLRGGSANPDDTPLDSPRPAYYIFPYLSKIFGRNLVSCSDNGTDLRSWASTDASGDLTVVLVNNNISTADTATLNISGFTPLGGTNQGKVWTLQSAGTTKSGATTPLLQKRWIDINGTVNPAVSALPPAAGAVGQGNAITTGASFSVNVPAASIVLVKVPHNTGPTPTHTPFAGTPTFSPSPTRTPTPSCGLLLNGMETLAENGAWGGVNAARSLVTSATAPAGAVTQGTYALKATLSSDSAWNNGIMNLGAFTPPVLGTYTQLKMDIYAEAALLTGQGWHGLQLLADCASCASGGKWSQPIAAADWTLAAGANAVTWDLNFAAGTLLPTDAISTLYIVYNHQSAVTGSLYADNMRLVAAGCTAPTATPSITRTPYAGPTCVVPVDNMESLTENGTWSGGLSVRSLVASGAAPPGAVTQGSFGIMVNVTSPAAYNNDVLQHYGFVPTNVGQYDQLRMSVYLSPALAATSTYHQLLLFADCASCSPAKYYQQIGAAQTIVSGANSVAWTVDLSLGSLLPTDPISGLNFVYVSQGTGTGPFYIDQLQLYRMGACFTPTPTPTRTRTASPSGTPTRTPSPSSSPSPTRTASPSPIANSPTATGTPTRTASPSPVPNSPTATPSASRTATRTATPSASASASPPPTASPSATRTATPSASPSASASPSGTRSATPSVTRTASPSASVTVTLTDVPVGSTATITPSISPTWSASPSFTPSATRSASPSASPSATPSGTRSATPSASPSHTPGPSATASATPLGSATFTPSGSPTTLVSATFTPTRSTTPQGSATASPTRTLSASGTVTPSQTSSASPTTLLTASTTPTASITVLGSATFSPTSSVSPLPTPTFTATPSATPPSSATLTATRTVTPLGSASFTATLSASPTRSQTPLPSASATPTATLSASPTSGPSPTATPQGPSVLGISAGEGATAGGLQVTLSGSGFLPGAQVFAGGQALSSVTWIDAHTLSGVMPAHAPGPVDLVVLDPDGRSGTLPQGFNYKEAHSGPLLILDAQAWPNPSPQFVSVKLSAPAERLTVKVWSRALIALGSLQQAGVEGWQQLPLKALLDGLPNGTYFATVEAQNGRVQPPPGPPLRFVVLH